MSEVSQKVVIPSIIGKLWFTLILNLTLLGSWNVYQWYKTAQPTQFDASQYDDDSLSKITKNVFEEQQARRKENRG